MDQLLWRSSQRNLCDLLGHARLSSKISIKLQGGERIEERENLKFWRIFQRNLFCLRSPAGLKYKISIEWQGRERMAEERENFGAVFRETSSGCWVMQGLDANKYKIARE